VKQAVLADTGPLYAAVDPDDAHHARARRELNRLAQDKLEVVVAYPTLLEAYTLVLYRLGMQAATAWLSEILNGALLLNPTSQDYREAVSRLVAFPDQPITLFDATTAVLAARFGMKVWTYDHHFDVMRAAVWR
jgi:predicted nucleic acid-binding protein